MSCFDEVIYFENGINTQFFDPPSSETTKSLYKDLIQIHSSVLLVWSVFFQFLLPKSIVKEKRKYNKSV